MQTLTWYIKRARGMSAGEITWRLRSLVRDRIDRLRFRFGLYPTLPRGTAGPVQPAFRVSDLAVGAWTSPGRTDSEARWLDGLLARAAPIARHQLSFFTLRSKHLGDPIDWNRDHENGVRAPMEFGPGIDYRDFRVTGDAKLVWEPNRHQQLVVLGRAYRATGDTRYADAVAEQLESWLTQCPFGRGMNWRSPLELAIRLINWVWALDLIRESGRPGEDLRARITESVHLHLWEITRKYSRGSSANNHLIGEAAGVFIGTTYFPDLPNAAQWQSASQAILAREIMEQTFSDGGTREQAFGYHLFVLQFFLIAGLVAKRTHRDFPAPYWRRLEGMLEFAGALVEAGDEPPMFGDADDGYVLDLGVAPTDARSLLAVGAVLFERADFARCARGCSEGVRWLLGASGLSAYAALSGTACTRRLVSRAFPDAGYYLLQCGGPQPKDQVSVLFDCGDLGFKSIAAHGHADALSFALRAFGIDLFVDPGTYDYFTLPEWRNYFRSTQAHNTVTVDGIDQSEMLGPFLWGRRARSRCLLWHPTAEGGKVGGEHDGYTRLADPVLHRRELELNGQARSLTISDAITGAVAHNIALHFHLSEHCRLRPAAPGRYEIITDGGKAILSIDPKLSVEVLHGSERPQGGWISRGYHRKIPAYTLRCTVRGAGDCTFRCRVEL